MGYIATEKMPGKLRNRPIKDYTGIRFGRLVASYFVERVESGGALWCFSCDCGNSIVRNVKSVRTGTTRSCGCLFRETMIERNTKHGLCKNNPKEYRSWKDMRGRCNTPTDSDYADYGGRGIRVCERWDDFAAFLADMGKRPDGCTIDRVDVNGDYEPGNCRWAPAKVQANNKRTNHLIQMRGETRTLQQWCDELAIEPSKVRYRLKKGWAIARAFSKEDFRKCS